ncbi:MAG TPA: DUF1440 domain-containing protein [Terriglobales bacterium]|nr:DUF1440 domain-containing protein [Terriglobales bacterium]
MRNRGDRRFLKGALAGMMGGLVASWVMNEFQSGVSKVEESWQKSSHQPQPERQSSDPPATARFAQRLGYAILGRDLTPDEVKIAEPVVHYAFGAFSGGFYGLVSELVPSARKGTGILFGAALWLIADEIAVPKLRLSKSPAEYGPKVHAEALASHLVYGVATEGIRRGIRAVA